MVKSMNFYVYGAYGINGELLYIGKGKGNRYKHCNSGISSCKDLNRYYFANGEELSISVKLLENFKTNKEALKFEQEMITELKPMFNKSLPPEVESVERDRKLLSMGAKVDYVRTMSNYIQAVEKCDKNSIEKLELLSPLHKIHLEKVGIEQIKRVKCNKARVIKKFNRILEIESNFHNVKVNLTGINVGEKYTSQYLMERLKKVYSIVGLNDIAIKSTEIERFFVVKNFLS